MIVIEMPNKISENLFNYCEVIDIQGIWTEKE